MNFKKLARIFLMVATLLLPSVLHASNPKPFVVPEIRQWKGADGMLTLIPGQAKVFYTSPSLKEVADNFASDYKQITGRDISVVKGKGSKGDIIFSLKKDRNLSDEGYRIAISDRITVSSPAVAGARWGASTLLQLRDASPDFPKGTITDFPQYGFRGFMIDVGRKYIPMNYLYKLVDVMSYRKMNELHIHLNDNGFKGYFDNDWDKTPAAFRLECSTFPGLTARDGSYTKQEFRDLQKYAESRGVEIIPEIDFPAHSLAFTRFKPEIAADGTHVDRDHLDLSNPATYEFLDALLKEYLGGPDPVFTGSRFHIGTDEYNGDSITMEKFRAMTDRYIRYTESFSKTPVVWGALTHAKGSTPVKSEGVEMYLWYNGYAQPKDMLEQGYKVVCIPDGYVYIVPGAGYYYDYLNAPMLYEKWTPANIGSVDVGEGHPQLLGGMFAVWNDHPNNGITVRDIHHRVMAAMPVMAAKNWSGTHVTVPYEEFGPKSAAMREAPGVNYLARHGKPHQTVLELADVAPGSKLPIDEIGYDYTIEFDLEGAPEEKGTALFSTPEATFWISDPISGVMGYSREGKLMQLRHDVRPGEKNHYRITGDNKGVKFYIDGKLVDDMNITWKSFGVREKLKKTSTMADIKTLVFPLANAGNFKSKLTNLSVKNYID